MTTVVYYSRGESNFDRDEDSVQEMGKGID